MMPLYTYFCETCGAMDMSVRLKDIDKVVACPICSYNAYRAKGGEQEFDDWVRHSFTGFVEKNHDNGYVALRKLVDAPARIRIR